MSLDWNMARANHERYQDMIREAEQRRSLKAALASSMGTANDHPQQATRRSQPLVGWLAAVLIALKLSR